jgi:hypothetical protein
MSVIKDIALAERNNLFIPDEIHVALMCETKFDFFKDLELCEELATKIYDK